MSDAIPPSVSIVTVCKNEVARIRKTAESVVAQICSDYEWIVVDGGSTDGTLEILEGYRSRIAHLVSGSDQGIYDAMNKGIRIAKGDYILFLNGGDILHCDNVLELVIPELNSDVVYGRIMIVRKGQNSGFLNNDLPKIHRSHFFAGKNIPHQGAFIKRSLFHKYGDYDCRYKVIADRVKFDEFARSGVDFKQVQLVVSKFMLGGISNDPSQRNIVENELEQWRQSTYPLRYKLLKSKIYIANAFGECLRMFVKSIKPYFRK